jgi:sulfite exporter TauE/SafE
MVSLQLLPVFMIGLLGSVHCIGMCGGIVSALSAAGAPAARPAARRIIPLVPAGGPAAMRAMPLDTLTQVLSYNAGRIGSYALAGAVAGGAAQGVRTLAWLTPLQGGALWAANLMLVALGLYLIGAWQGLARLEAIGQPIWRRMQPAIRCLLPMDRPAKAFALGALWGWLPCGMVYSVLLTAMLSGSALSGAAVMLAFGLGTMPVLLAAGVAGDRLRAWTRQPRTRLVCGMIVLAFGLFGLLRAAHGVTPSWLDILCITPAIHGAH